MTSSRPTPTSKQIAPRLDSLKETCVRAVGWLEAEVIAGVLFSCSAAATVEAEVSV